MAPIVAAHRRLLIVSLVAALGAMLAQVAVPAVIRQAIDRALVDGGAADLQPLMVLMVALGVARALLTLAYRYGLYRMAFEIDADLRTLLYDHLSGLSFSFYDRTQSGQIISRANSDIRSVQMFLVFAPIISMSGVMLVVAVAYMASIHLWLTLAAIAPLPGVYVLGKRLRDEVFPLSWIVQSRMADGVLIRIVGWGRGLRCMRSSRCGVR